MHFPQAKNEVNVNTIIQIVGFLVVIAGMGVQWGQTRTDVDVLNREQAVHSSQISALQVETSKIENLTYRITVQEQGSASLARSVDELKAAVNGQGADIKVMREILTRLDRQITGRPISNGQ